MDYKIGNKKMRLKHNKKRNTAFLFETLTREYIKSVVKKNTARQIAVKNIIKKNFAKGTVLNEELNVYREVLETENLTEQSAEKLLSEAKGRYQGLDKQDIFKSQNRLIKEVNYTLSPDVFSNFVPNYKNLATVYSIFNNKTTIKEKMLLEKKVVENLTTNEEDNQQHIDNITYKTFVESFNKKYVSLPDDQKELLTNYIASFSDNSVSLKMYMNEQVSDLKDRLASCSSSEILQSQEELKEKYQKVVEKLESYKNREIDDIMVEEVLKVQELVRELEDA
jgi:hypothetical protein